jgi:hypothetical protein
LGPGAFRREPKFQGQGFFVIVDKIKREGFAYAKLKAAGI